MNLELELLRLGGRICAAVLECWKNQWKKEADLCEMQRRYLSRLVRHAFTNVPFYRRLLKKERLSADDLEHGRWNKIPVLSKDIYRENPALFELNDPSGLVREIISSGTTGPPARILQDSEKVAYKTAAHLRALFAYGAFPFQRHARIRHTGEEMIEQCPSSLMLRLLYSSWHVQSASLSAIKQLDWLQKIKPFSIYSSAMNLEYLAHAMQNAGKYICPKLIFASSSQLTDEARQRIVGTFGREPYDIYNTTEFGDIAWQCPHGNGFHLNADNFMIELLDENDEPVSEGELGRVVVTDFHNKMVPLIRFDLGDLASSSKDRCPCGRTLPIVSQIIGKRMDLLVAPSGRAVNPNSYRGGREVFRGISWYRIVQTGRAKLTVEYVRSKETMGYPQPLVSWIEKAVGYDFEIALHELDRPPRNPREKLIKIKAMKT